MINNNIKFAIEVSNVKDPRFRPILELLKTVCRAGHVTIEGINKPFTEPEKKDKYLGFGVSDYADGVFFTDTASNLARNGVEIFNPIDIADAMRFTSRLAFYAAKKKKNKELNSVHSTFKLVNGVPVALTANDVFKKEEPVCGNCGRCNLCGTKVAPSKEEKKKAKRNADLAIRALLANALGLARI